MPSRSTTLATGLGVSLSATAVSGRVVAELRVSIERVRNVAGYCRARPAPLRWRGRPPPLAGSCCLAKRQGGEARGHWDRCDQTESRNDAAHDLLRDDPGLSRPRLLSG